MDGENSFSSCTTMAQPILSSKLPTAQREPSGVDTSSLPPRRRRGPGSARATSRGNALQQHTCQNAKLPPRRLL